MFYCCEEELRTMNRRYDKGRFECIVIYGRRRVGKTALINEFCKGKPTVYFSALNASAQENLEALSKAIYSCKNPESFSFPTYQNCARISQFFLAPASTSCGRSRSLKNPIQFCWEKRAASPSLLSAMARMILS